MIPHRTPFFLPLLYPSLHWRMPAESKSLYLTFDDGPVPGPTEFVLDTLNRFSVKATFFCIGNNIQKHPEIFKKILAGGHAVGNHTFNHISGWSVPEPVYTRDIMLCEEELLKYQPFVKGKGKIFRPPYGRISRKQIKALHDYHIIMWDVLSVDYKDSLSKEACLIKTWRVIRPGSIIVFHDSYKAEKNLSYVLPRLIQNCLEQGYTFNLLEI